MSDARSPRARARGAGHEAGEASAMTSAETEGSPRLAVAPMVGFIAGAAPGGALLVDFEGNAAGPLPARSTVPLDADAVLAALAARREVVLLFERGDPGRPIIIGMVEPPAPLLELMLGDLAADDGGDAGAPRNAGEANSETTDRDGGDGGEASTEVRAALAPAVATLDGRRVVLEGRDEVVLRCGEASITLRRNGKVIIRGAYVETHAAGINRIKGGAVRIN
jgi:Domain of unknown function (DUF6484)